MSNLVKRNWLQSLSWGHWGQAPLTNIFYGIGETSGAASILAGISIPNIDRFELDRRNELQAIRPTRPTVPDVAFSFISLQLPKGQAPLTKCEQKFVKKVSAPRYYGSDKQRYQGQLIKIEVI